MARKTNCTINGIDYYRIRKVIGKDKYGKPIEKAFYGSSKRDAENKYQQWRDERAKGLTIHGNQSLTQSMHIWLWQIERRSGNKSSTFSRYEVIYRLDIDGSPLGFMDLQDVDKLALHRHYNDMYDDGNSYSKIMNCNKLLNKFFNYCLTEGYILRNPCFKIKLDAYNDKSDELNIHDELEDEGKIETLSENEIKTILKFENRKLAIISGFAIGTGLRQGEILALNISDVDLDKMEVRVTKTWSFGRVFKSDGSYEYKTQITTPKTKTSRRKVPLPHGLKKDLLELKKIRLEEQLKLGNAYKKNNLMFPSETGTYINARNLKTAWERMLRRLEIPPRTFHSTRHTFASQLLERDRKIQEVSRLLGHASIQTTERYIHVVQATKAEAVQVLNDLFL